MKKGVNILNAILVSLILIGDVFYILKGTLLIKSITSAGFVLLGGVNLFYALKSGFENKKFCIIMFIGLFFAMLGDILLEIDFIIGAILFAVGHVFFFVSYSMLYEFRVKDLLYCLSIFIPAAALILYAPFFKFEDDVLKILCVAYAFVISGMTGKALSNFFNNKNLLTFLIVLGSSLFLFSDLMLLFDEFSNISVVFGYLCLITYYPAECILAYSIKRKTKA